jgi:hypothetical protein
MARVRFDWQDDPHANYGRRDRFGPLRYQLVRFVGRLLESAGIALNSRSWRWRG